MVKLSIIIPAHNEEERIEKTLMGYIKFFNIKLPDSYNVIVIPNNCQDKTTEIVSNLAKKYKQISYKEFKKKIGKSGALIEGFKLAQGDLIGFTDADNSAPPESFYKLITNLKNFDGAIGSRWLPSSNITLKQPFMRRVFSRSFNLLIRFLLNLKYYDTQCGLKLFKKEPIKKILPSLGKALWAFDMDLLYQLKRNNFKIVEVPIKWSDDPRTHLNMLKAPIQMFLALVRLRLLYSPLKFVLQLYDKLPEKVKIHHRIK